MFDWLKEFLLSPAVPVMMVLIIALANNLLENLFPPSPGDTVLLFLGTLIGIGKVDFPMLLLFSTIGSVAGFAIMFSLGRVFGKRIVDTDRFKFINSESLKKPEEWFQKYGYWVIVINRFLSGTRAVISFFAGISKLNTVVTIVLGSLSSIIWNAFIIYLGMQLGENWESADYYLSQYGKFVLILAVAVIAYFAIRYYLKRKKNGNNSRNY
jgi:membrane protein DedA with SNARE-associated domain